MVLPMVETTSMQKESKATISTTIPLTIISRGPSVQQAYKMEKNFLTPTTLQIHEIGRVSSDSSLWFTEALL
jgi:hypothetical protein